MTATDSENIKRAMRGESYVTPDLWSVYRGNDPTTTHPSTWVCTVNSEAKADTVLAVLAIERPETKYFAKAEGGTE